MNSLVTVIVPVYNVEIYLKKCIESILYQTYENIEIILVDDGSTDNSGAICDEYLHKDSRIIVIHKDNGGLGSARNAALNVCKGEYIAFIDSDDWVEKDFVERLLEYSDENTLVCCGYQEVFENRKVNNNVETLLECTTIEFIDILLSCELARANGSKNNPIGNYMCNKLWPRKCFSELRFSSRNFEDIYLSMDLIMKIEKAVIIPFCLYNYFQRNNSIIYSQRNNNDFLNAILRQEEVLYRYINLRKKVQILVSSVAAMCVKYDLDAKQISTYKNLVKSRLSIDFLKYRRIAFKVFLFLYLPSVLKFLYRIKNISNS